MVEYQGLWQIKDTLKAEMKDSIAGEIEDVARRQTADLGRVVNEALAQTAQRVLNEVNFEKVSGPMLENMVRNVVEGQCAELVQQAVSSTQYPKLIQAALAAVTPEVKKAKEVFSQVVEETAKEVIREAIIEALGNPV